MDIKIDYHIAKKSLDNDVYCGDTAIIKEFGGKVFIGIVDVLGHGKEADQVARICDRFLGNNCGEDLIATIKGLHLRISKTRGAVASLCLVDLKTCAVRYVGVGDITAIKFGPSPTRFVGRSGVIGYALPTLREESTKLHDGDLIVLHTDGVSGSFAWNDYQEIFEGDARTIAERIMGKYRRETDDALCIVFKYTQMSRDGHR